MIKAVDYIFGAVYYLSLLLPVAGGLVYYRSVPRTEKVFLALLVVIWITETAALAMAFGKMNNHSLYQVYFLIESLMLSWLFFMWAEKKSVKTAVSAGCFLVLAAWAYSHIGPHLRGSFRNTHLMTEGIIFAILSGYFMLRTFAGSQGPALNNPRLWLSTGLLINFTGNILIYSSLDFVLTLAPALWRLHWMINVLVNIVYTAGFASGAWTGTGRAMNDHAKPEMTWDTAES